MSDLQTVLFTESWEKIQQLVPKWKADAKSWTEKKGLDFPPHFDTAFQCLDFSPEGWKEMVAADLSSGSLGVAFVDNRSVKYRLKDSNRVMDYVSERARLATCKESPTLVGNLKESSWNHAMYSRLILHFDFWLQAPHLVSWSEYQSEYAAFALASLHRLTGSRNLKASVCVRAPQAAMSDMASVPSLLVATKGKSRKRVRQEITPSLKLGVRQSFVMFFNVLVPQFFLPMVLAFISAEFSRRFTSPVLLGWESILNSKEWITPPFGSELVECPCSKVAQVIGTPFEFKCGCANGKAWTPPLLPLVSVFGDDNGTFSACFGSLGEHDFTDTKSLLLACNPWTPYFGDHSLVPLPTLEAEPTWRSVLADNALKLPKNKEDELWLSWQHPAVRKEISQVLKQCWFLPESIRHPFYMSFSTALSTEPHAFAHIWGVSVNRTPGKLQLNVYLMTQVCLAELKRGIYLYHPLMRPAKWSWKKAKKNTIRWTCGCKSNGFEFPLFPTLSRQLEMVLNKVLRKQ